MTRPRSESPPVPASLLSSAPSTPNLRNRNPFTETVASSPTSATMSDASLHVADDTSFRSYAAGFTGTRKSTIRSDPALVTCFDPADRRLYDLWAPKY